MTRVSAMAVWRAYRVRLKRTRLVQDKYTQAMEAQRVRAAYRALRTRAQRQQILTDLAVQPGWLWRTVAHLDVAVLADAALPPLDPSAPAGGLIEACDRRALAREAAALRLERTEARWAGSRTWRRVRAGARRGSRCPGSPTHCRAPIGASPACR
jgi:hypothetical protein